MINRYKYFVAFTLAILFLGATSRQEKDPRFLSYVIEPSMISFFWKDDKGQIFRSLKNLKVYVEHRGKELKFAMNGGMYKRDNSPQGLYIENNLEMAPLDTLSGAGNFYLKPNGVFYITKNNIAVVCQTNDFKNTNQIKFATQSGPMLLIDGEFHPAFKKGSTNLNIRNGIGILPDNKVIFAMSKQEVNFYDFAEFFKSMNCKNALYLDGFVSRTYLPEENFNQLDGNFGVIIAVTK